MRHFTPPRLAGPTLEALQAAEPLFDVARIGIWLVDLADGALWWSRMTRRIHEVPRSFRPTLDNAIDFYAPEARETIRSLLADAQAHFNSWERTLPAVSFRGRHLLLQSAGLVVAEDGIARYVLGTCRDVTDATLRATEHERLALVVRQMTNAAIITDPQGHAIWANPAFEKLTGRPLAQFIGKKPGHVLQGPQTDPETVRAIGEAIRLRQPFHGEILNYNVSGEPYWIELSISPFRNEEGAHAGFIGIESDATPRRAAEAAAQRELEARGKTQTLLRDIIDAVPVVLSAYDSADRLILVNQQLHETFPALAGVLQAGCSLEHAVREWHRREGTMPETGEAALDRQVAEDLQTIRWGMDAVETQLPNGRWLLSSARRTSSNNLIVVRTDITALKQGELAAREQARRDELTGLLNRSGFLERLKALKALKAQTPADGQNGPSAGCMIVFDIDHFKAVNDAYGHEAGDQLLRTIARRLARAIRKTDLPARLGGDEFALFLPDITPERAPQRVEQIIGAIARTTAIGPVKLLPSISCGAALAGQHGEDCEDLLRNADRALYEAKRMGRARIVFYAERLAEQLANRQRVAERLKRAIDADRVQIALQPKLRLADRRISGFEALARWHDGDRQVPPLEFVEAADEHGLAERLGRLVMKKALAACARIHAETGCTLHVGVNVSTAQLLAENFAHDVLTMVDAAGLLPPALELEITETVLLDRSFARIVRQLTELSDAGVRIALDDFGTGHASLNHVGLLPIHSLKIDRSFVAAIGTDHRRALIATSIIGLARGLNLECVAEGVETEAQLAFLERQHCSHVQGYLTGRPMPLEDALALLAPVRKARARGVERRELLAGGDCRSSSRSR